MQFASSAYLANTPRPAYVKFEKRSLETRDPAANVLFVDEDYAIVTSPGSPNNAEKLVKEWLPNLLQQVKNGTYPGAWYEEYKGAYERWKNDQAPAVNGTDIRNWPSISPAEAKNLTALGIMAVEDVANMNDEVCQRLGMGSVSLRQRARDYLTAQKDTAPLVARLDAMQAELNRANHRGNELEAELLRIKSSGVPAGYPPMQMAAPRLESLEDRLSSAQAGVSDKNEVANAIDAVLDEELS